MSNKDDAFNRRQHREDVFRGVAYWEERGECEVLRREAQDRLNILESLRIIYDLMDNLDNPKEAFDLGFKLGKLREKAFNLSRKLEEREEGNEV